MLKHLRRPKIRQRVSAIVIFILIAACTVALACFALGAWQVPPRELRGELDVKGNSISGTFDAASDTYLGPVNIVFASGAVYDGGFEGHRFNGYGVFEGQDVSEEGELLTWRFEGTFVNGKLEGEGSYIDQLGSYRGSFTDSLPDGRGVYTSTSGWIYEGEFEAGTITGRGTVQLADGTISSGLFEDGQQISTE